MAKKGRPTANKAEYAGIAERACAELGADDNALAEVLGVNVATVNRWKKAHPEFCESLKRGKDHFDTTHVEAALLKRALGYECTERTYVGQRLKKRVIKEIAPDVTAQIFWLKNRDPVRWRDKQDLDVTGKVTLTDIMAEVVASRTG